MSIAMYERWQRTASLLPGGRVVLNGGGKRFGPARALLVRVRPDIQATVRAIQDEAGMDR